MNDIINVEEILQRKVAILYNKVWSEQFKKDFKAAIKEIVEAVVDKYSEKVKPYLDDNALAEFEAEVGDLTIKKLVKYE